jgi:hypothetical protein
LENFIQTSEDEPLVNMARNMLGILTVDEPLAEPEAEETETEEQAVEAVSEEAPTEDETEEAESPYKNNPNQTHIFVIVNGPRESEGIQKPLAGFGTVSTAKISQASDCVPAI